MAEPIPLKKAPDSHVEARASTLRMAASWCQLAQRMAGAAAAATDEAEVRRLGAECLHQLSMTRDIVAAVMGALPETATPRALLAEMTEMFRAAGVEELKRNTQFRTELADVLGKQAELLDLVNARIPTAQKKVGA